MAGFKDIINRVKYAIYRKGVEYLPYREQLKVASEAYDIVDASYKNKVGDNIALCSVNFQCPYEGHVAYHCDRILRARKADESDILVDYVIERNGDSDWVLTVAVNTSDANPHVAADAVAMATVLHIPTVLGSFSRFAETVPQAVPGMNLAEISFC
jgi:hypothetical protein